MSKRRLLIALIALLTLALLVGCTTRKLVEVTKPQLVVHLIDVGQGDSILLQAGDSAVLIDAAERNKAASIVEYLKQQGVKRIDLFISTHPHADHIGGAVEVLKNFDVKKIIDSGKVHTSQTYIDYLRYIDEKNIPFEVVEFQRLELAPGVTLEILGPIKEYSNLNDNSVVTKVSIGTQAVLLTGDMEHTAEKDLLSSGANVSATVLKVSHHGSRTSTTEDFLKAVGPKVALISVGAGNTYGHPTEEALQRLTAVGATVYRSDIRGTIRVTLDGSTYTVTTAKGSVK